MIGFEKMSQSNAASYIPSSLIGEDLSQIQRGNFTTYADTVNGYGLYLPPPLEFYTQFSLQEYFIMFCGILLFQTSMIFILDQLWLDCLPKDVTILEKILHAHLKSHFMRNILLAPLSWVPWVPGNPSIFEQ